MALAPEGARALGETVAGWGVLFERRASGAAGTGDPGGLGPLASGRNGRLDDAGASGRNGALDDAVVSGRKGPFDGETASGRKGPLPVGCAG